jgi:hypothetical protein
MATRTRTNRGGRRRGGGRSTPGGPAALVSRVTGMLGGNTGRRGAGRHRGVAAGSGLATRAASFVRGFMSGGGSPAGRRGRRRH